MAVGVGPRGGVAEPGSAVSAEAGSGSSLGTIVVMGAADPAGVPAPSALFTGASGALDTSPIQGDRL